MPFNLTAEDEAKFVSYITEMQSIGFGLGATSFRRSLKKIENKDILQGFARFFVFQL
jgi:hypothetical protein